MINYEPQNEGEIVIYQPDESIRLEVKLDTKQDTVWLTQQQIAELFGTKRPAITKHLNNIYQSGELDKEGTCSILEHMGNDGKQLYSTAYYNLDAILAVGYRVSSKNATAFRRWATNVLKNYLLRGYAIHQQLVQMEARLDNKILLQHDEIKQIKERQERQQKQLDFFIQTNVPPAESHDRWLIIDDRLCQITLQNLMFYSSLAIQSIQVGLPVLISMNTFAGCKSSSFMRSLM